MVNESDYFAVEKIIEGQSEYFDFSKSFLAVDYLTRKADQLTKIPKYIPDETIEVYNKLWKKVRNHRPTFDKALLTLYHNQTDDEIEVQHSIYKNIEGFNKSEAKYLTKMAEILLKRPLDLVEVATCVAAIRKYLVQLMLDIEFMHNIGMGMEYRTLVAPFAEEIQEIRRRG